MISTSNKKFKEYLIKLKYKPSKNTKRERREKNKMANKSKENSINKQKKQQTKLKQKKIYISITSVKDNNNLKDYSKLWHRKIN